MMNLLPVFIRLDQSSVRFFTAAKSARGPHERDVPECCNLRLNGPWRSAHTFSEQELALELA